MHTDWESAGEFSCSNPKINNLEKAVRRTLSNSAHSMPGEEPTREKMGWTQDGLNTMEAAVYNFRAAPVYTNYLFDMIDAQEANGHVPPIVPTDGWGRTQAGRLAPRLLRPLVGRHSPLRGVETVRVLRRPARAGRSLRTHETLGGLLEPQLEGLPG